jgi:hypothetical protein
MKFEIAIVIAIAWFIIRAISRAAKNNKANLQRGGQNSNNFAESPQNIIDRETEATHSRVAQSAEGRSLEVIMQEASRSIVDPFIVPRSLEDNASSHYSETSLVQEYKRSHEEGKAVAHHRHKLFNEKKDRRVAASHQQNPERHSGTARDHASMHSPAPLPSKRAARRESKVHPIAALLRDKNGLQQGFIVAEVLKRPEF